MELAMDLKQGRGMKKNLLSLIIFFTLVANAENRIQEKKVSPRKGITYRTYSLLGGPVKYQISYNSRKDEKTGMFSVGDTSTHSTGLGMNYAWYGNGFLRIAVNGKFVTAPAEKIACNEGTLTFTWPEVDLNLNFPENSDRIFGEITVAPGNNLEVAFLANPGYRHKRTDYVSWISSGNVNQKLSDRIRPVEAPWIMAYDEMENPRGIAALVFDPEQIRKKSFSGTGKSSIITLHFSVKGNRFRFILQGIPGSHMDAETLHGGFMKNSGKYLEELKQFQFQGE